jgi:hypothetical protein
MRSLIRRRWSSSGTAQLARQVSELQGELDRYRLGWPPGHFYSPIPDLDEIRRSEERVFDVPEELSGVALNVDAQLALLEELAQYHADQPFRNRRQRGLRYFFDNPNFTQGEGIAFHALLRHLRPRRVIEIGSGYSSCLLLDTVDRFLGGSSRCTFVEPDPALLLSLVDKDDRERLDIVARPVQDVDLSLFDELAGGDVLFVDSTHVAKVGSDVNHLVFQVLPRLARGVVVHFHDIEYPFEYPKRWIYEGRAWNEVYLMRAFLQYNDTFEIVLYPSYLARFHHERLERALPLCARMPGSSLWLRRVG